MTDRMTEQEIEALCEALQLTSEVDSRFVCLPPAMFAKALTAIRQLQQPWRGMETLPCDTEVVAYYFSSIGEQRNIIGERYDMVDNAVISRASGNWIVCEGWMPLPAPPEQEG